MIPSIMVIMILYGAMIMKLRVNLDNQLTVGLVHSLMTLILRLSARVAVLQTVHVLLNHNRSRNNLPNDSTHMGAPHQCQTAIPHHHFRRSLRSRTRQTFHRHHLRRHLRRPLCQEHYRPFRLKTILMMTRVRHPRLPPLHRHPLVSSETHLQMPHYRPLLRPHRPLLR